MITTGKIKTLIKETDYLTMLRIINRNLFPNAKVTVDKTMLKKLINIVVDNKIKRLLEECAASNPACQGRLDLIPNNIFSFVNFDAVSEDNFTPKIPDIDNDIVEALTNKTINEIKLYKLITDKMKEFAASVKNDISKITNKDLNDYFMLEPVSNFYILELLQEQGYTSQVTEMNILGQMTNISVPYNNPMDLLKTGNPAIDTAVNDMLNEYPDKEDIIETALRLIDVNTLNVLPADIPNFIYVEAELNKLYSLPVAVLVLVGYRNLIRIARENNLEDTMLGLGKIYNIILNYYKRLVNQLNKAIESKFILTNIEKDNNGIYKASLIKEVYNEAKAENENIDYNVLFGAMIVKSNENNSILTMNELLSNILLYKDAISKFNKMLTLKNKQEDLTILRSIYRYQISKAIKSMDNKLTKLVNNDPNFIEALLNRLTIDDMVNVQRGSKLVFVNLFNGSTRFYDFINYIERSTDFLGNDIDSEDAVMLATLQLLTDYLIGMVKPV